MPLDEDRLLFPGDHEQEKYTIRTFKEFLAKATRHYNEGVSHSERLDFTRDARQLTRLVARYSELTGDPIRRESGKTNKILILNREQFYFLYQVIARHGAEGHSYDYLIRDLSGLPQPEERQLGTPPTQQPSAELAALQQLLTEQSQEIKRLRGQVDYMVWRMEEGLKPNEIAEMHQRYREARQRMHERSAATSTPVGSSQ